MSFEMLVSRRNQIKAAIVALLVTGIVFFILAFALPAKAEPKLVETSPERGAYLAYSSDTVRVSLKFDTNLKADASTFTITREDGVDKAVPITPRVNGSEISVILPSRDLLGANRYIVNYTVVSGTDNSVGAGSFEFFIVPQSRTPLDLGYLFSTPSSAFTSDWKGYSYPPLATIFFFLALAGTVVGNLIFFYGRYQFFSNNRLTFTVVTKASRNLAIISSIGFAFFLCRIANLQPFNARVFLYAVSLYSLFLLVRGLIYMTRTYPKAKAEWRALQEKNRPRKTAAPVVTASPASVSADAGDEDDAQKREEARAAIGSPRGLSSRGEKRRAKKRDRR
jgi:methionine-rich copper-binding protein CopC